jgi:hypothetical protein
MRRLLLIFVFGLLLASPFGWARELHYSNWSDNPQPYIDAIHKCAGQPFPTVPAGYTIRGGIVTHHFLASGLMVRFFEGLRTQSSPETVILLGPNHFHQGLADISVSSLPWKTPFGILPTDTQLVHKISRAIRLPEDPEAFSGEHSVSILIPFLKYYFPHSRVVPILIDVNTQDSRMRELRDVLSLVLKDEKVLVLLSMDFSHHSVSSIADTRDLKAKEVISSMDAKGTRDLRVDSRKGLRLLIELLNRNECDKVQFNEHTNSARLTGKLNQPDVTSYFTIYFLNTSVKGDGK